MAEEFLYSDKDLKKLSEDGHNLYKMAEQDLNSENWYKAGDKYDRSYTGAWGDALFAGIEFGTDQFAFSGLSIPIPYLSQEEKKNIFEDSLSESKCRLVVSCEFYLKAIEIDPNHFYANLQLASALTAALQVTPACAYWKKSIQLNKSVALAALTADSMAKFHRGTATRLVITALEGDQSKMQNAITQLQFNSSFFEQMELAKVLLESSPYIRSKIEEDKGVKGSERLKAEELYNEGNANAGLGEFEIALSMYEKAISFDRSNPMYFNNRAATLKRLERFKEAIDQYEEITREFPQYGKAFLSIGSTNIEIGEYQAAVSAYRKFDSAFRSGKFEFSPIVGGLDQTIQGGDLLQTVILTSINYLSPNHQELAIQAFQEAINEISAPLPLKPRVLSPSVSKTVYEPNKFSEINVEVQSTNNKTFDKGIIQMRGTVLSFSIQSNGGFISGDDGNRYQFVGSDWNLDATPAQGMRLDFDVDGKKAVSIYSDPTNTYASSSQAPKSRTTAGILALLLGGFGAQFFYLGARGWGWASVLLFWTYVPAIVGLILGIRYLCMTDQEFERRVKKMQGPFGEIAL